MIVVADASPLNYLVLIEQIGLLPTLYGSVLIPEAVHRELQRPGRRLSERGWPEAAPGHKIVPSLVRAKVWS